MADISTLNVTGDFTSSTNADLSKVLLSVMDVDKCVPFFNSSEVSTNDSSAITYSSIPEHNLNGTGSDIEDALLQIFESDDNWSCESDSAPFLPTVRWQVCLGKQLLSENLANERSPYSMLSPPSSCEGDIDCESLFPELTNFDAESASETSEYNQDCGYMLNTQDMIEGTIVSVAESQLAVKVEPGAQLRPPTKLGRPPKYAQLEPSCGYAVSGHLSKNAVLARENRRKKKEYITSLEEQVSQLTTEKTELSVELSSAKTTIDSQKEEIDYLKSIIANETTIGKLLDHIPNSDGLTINRGNGKRPRAATKSTALAPNTAKRQKSDHDYTATSVTDIGDTKPGVCLHVAAGVVSLEFCKKCNQAATA